MSAEQEDAGMLSLNHSQESVDTGQSFLTAGRRTMSDVSGLLPQKMHVTV